MADDIDVKAEGRKIIGRQQQSMRDTAEYEEGANNRVKQMRKYHKTETGKEASESQEMSAIISTDANSTERKHDLAYADYLGKEYTNVDAAHRASTMAQQKRTAAKFKGAK